MRLFQLFSSGNGQIIALFNCNVSASIMSDDEVENIISSKKMFDYLTEYLDDEMFEEFENYMDKNNLEKIFVNEVYSIC